MRNNVVVNRDRLEYVYDDAGRVSAIRYVDASGVVFTTLSFSYDGQKLTEIERDRRVEGGFIIDKTMAFSYHADGNLLEMTEHRPAIEGHLDETTTVDRFEQYDDKINVDGFSLIHDDFFDHSGSVARSALAEGQSCETDAHRGRKLISISGLQLYLRRQEPAVGESGRTDAAERI